MFLPFRARIRTRLKVTQAPRELLLWEIRIDKKPKISGGPGSEHALRGSRKRHRERKKLRAFCDPVLPCGANFCRAYGADLCGTIQSWRSGRKTWKRAPCPGGDSRRIEPRWSSTIFATIERPRPTPSFFEVKNGLKICSRDSAGTPGPESSTITATPGLMDCASGAMEMRS